MPLCHHIINLCFLPFHLYTFGFFPLFLVPSPLSSPLTCSDFRKSNLAIAESQNCLRDTLVIVESE